MKIGELANQVSLNPKTIRYYESIGVLPEPARTPSGYREYDESVTEQVTFIRTAQRLGITLDEIREILSFQKRGKAPCAYVREVLDNQVVEIDVRIFELQELRGQLVELAVEAAELPPPDAGDVCPLIDHVRQKGVRNSTDRGFARRPAARR